MISEEQKVNRIASRLEKIEKLTAEIFGLLYPELEKSFQGVDYENIHRDFADILADETKSMASDVANDFITRARNLIQKCKL